MLRAWQSHSSGIFRQALGKEGAESSPIVDVRTHRWRIRCRINDPDKRPSFINVSSNVPGLLDREIVCGNDRFDRSDKIGEVVRVSIKLSYFSNVL